MKAILSDSVSSHVHAPRRRSPVGGRDSVFARDGSAHELHAPGSPIVVVANRLPVALGADGRWTASPGGLASAVSACLDQEATWIGWNGRSGTDHSLPPSRERLRLRPLVLTQREVDHYYDGFANSVLWPWLHGYEPAPIVDAWWQAYQRVNTRFAMAVAETAPIGARVIVHDYQLLLVPALVRAARPDLRIVMFIHTPYPVGKHLGRSSIAASLVRGMLGADVIGCQTERDRDHLLSAVEGLGTRFGLTHICHEGRRVHIGCFPVGIDAQHWSTVAADPRTIERAAALRRELDHPRTILLGVDRLDYTKGIEQRLIAYRKLLRSRRLDVEHATFIQIAVPSRSRVPAYRRTRQLIEALAVSINEEFPSSQRPAVDLRLEGIGESELAALYQAADVMLVTPHRDGMNLVAKEYVAARRDDNGALVLSTEAGAADQMNMAYLVDPANPGSIADAISTALKPDPCSRRRMRALRQEVFAHDARRWHEHLLAALG